MVLQLACLDAQRLGQRVRAAHVLRSEVGQEVKGFVRAVHPDGKMDLSLDAAGYQRVAPLVDQIVEALKQNGGRLAFDDDSSPESIREKFGVSKKAFKQAIGKLYKARSIRFLNPGIELIGGNS